MEPSAADPGSCCAVGEAPGTALLEGGMEKVADQRQGFMREVEAGKR